MMLLQQVQRKSHLKAHTILVISNAGTCQRYQILSEKRNTIRDSKMTWQTTKTYMKPPVRIVNKTHWCNVKATTVVLRRKVVKRHLHLVIRLHVGHPERRDCTGCGSIGGKASKRPGVAKLVQTNQIEIRVSNNLSHAVHTVHKHQQLTDKPNWLWHTHD